MKSIKGVDRRVSRGRNILAFFLQIFNHGCSKIWVKTSIFLIFESKMGFLSLFYSQRIRNLNMDFIFCIPHGPIVSGTNFHEIWRSFFGPKRNTLSTLWPQLGPNFEKWASFLIHHGQNVLGIIFHAIWSTIFFSIFEPKGDVLIPFVIHKGFKIWTLYLNWPCSK